MFWHPLHPIQWLLAFAVSIASFPLTQQDILCKAELLKCVATATHEQTANPPDVEVRVRRAHCLLSRLDTPCVWALAVFVYGGGGRGLPR